MKTLLVALSVLFLSGSVLSKEKDPVLMKINGNPVLKSEFEYIYNKNNSSNTLDKKTLDEYVDLFINFKLKVEEAKSQGIDTTQSFIDELKGYRDQLAKPYLTDTDTQEKVLLEAYNRLKEDVEVSHILIRVDQHAAPKDTLLAWNKALEVKERLQKEEFATVAKEVSEDQSVTNNGGYIGWITGFRTVYPFETMAYQTPVGEISKPVRSAFGYHIIKVHDKRKSPGEILAAHIMKFTSQGNDSLNAIAKNQIDSLYQLVLSGEDFGELASANSEDRGSAAKKGELPWFGTGRMVAEFEKAAFKLEHVGDVSEPVQSPYGWHIIKLLDTKPVPDFETKKPEIERLIQRDERASAGEKAFINQLKKEYKLTSLGSDLKVDFIKLLENKTLSDSTFLVEAAVLTSPMFKFANEIRTQADFLNYLKHNPSTDKTVAEQIIKEKYNDFIEKELIAYEKDQLENKYEDFRLLMQEYHDGILLFEVSNKEVWEKASKDTTGLTTFFKENQDQYTWDKPHFKGRIIQCKDEKTLSAAKEIIENQHSDSIDKYLKQLNDSVIYIKSEKGLFIEGDNQFVDKHIFNTSIEIEQNEAYPYVFVPGKLLQSPEDYTDVRGMVTADYQEYLENEWIENLRDKYKVRIYKRVLRKINRN